MTRGGTGALSIGAAGLGAVGHATEGGRTPCFFALAWSLLVGVPGLQGINSGPEFCSQTLGFLKIIPEMSLAQEKFTK
jgi:hypothetical protein